MRLEGKTAVIIGAGQAPSSGDLIGNGRATALTFAREGAKVLCVDRYAETADETVAMIEAKGGIAIAACADVTDEDALKQAIDTCQSAWGSIGILHNNVGLSVEAGAYGADMVLYCLSPTRNRMHDDVIRTGPANCGRAA